jgi:hypothetical protein
VPEPAAGDRALGELRRMIGARTAAVTLTGPSGKLLRVGDVDRDQATGIDRLTVTSVVSPDMTLTLTVDRANDRNVTPQERVMVDAAADLFTAWARRLGHDTPHRPERRAAAQRYEELVDRFARQARELGLPVAVVVLTLAGGLLPADLHNRIGDIRSVLRAADLVGGLGPAEIALLLHDATADHATVVAARVREMLDDSGKSNVPVVTAIGISARPGQGEGTLKEARARALTRDVA